MKFHSLSIPIANSTPNTGILQRLPGPPLQKQLSLNVPGLDGVRMKNCGLGIEKGGHKDSSRSMFGELPCISQVCIALLGLLRFGNGNLEAPSTSLDSGHHLVYRKSCQKQDRRKRLSRLPVLFDTGYLVAQASLKLAT